jgi:hypothetical protein
MRLRVTSITASICRRAAARSRSCETALGLLLGGVGRLQGAAHGAAGAEFTLRAVDAIGDRAVGREGAAARIGAGEDARFVLGLTGRLRLHQAGPWQEQRGEREGGGRQ